MTSCWNLLWNDVAGSLDCRSLESERKKRMNSGREEERHIQSMVPRRSNFEGWGSAAPPFVHWARSWKPWQQSNNSTVQVSKSCCVKRILPSMYAMQIPLVGLTQGVHGLRGSGLFGTLRYLTCPRITCSFWWRDARHPSCRTPKGLLQLNVRRCPDPQIQASRYVQDQWIDPKRD